MTQDSPVRRAVRAVTSAIAPGAPSRRRGDPVPPPRRALSIALIAGALAWLLVGCCGLLWTIAFTTDLRSMTIGLVVWVFGFVVPTTLATVIAYRLEEHANVPPRHPARRVRGAPVTASD